MGHFEQVFELVQSEAEAELSSETPDDLRSDTYRLKALRDLVKDASEIIPEFAKRGGSLITELERKAEGAESAADELETPEPDYDRESSPPSEDSVDVDLLFSDL